jgi:hypothetical protein
MVPRMWWWYRGVQQSPMCWTVDGERPVPGAGSGQWGVLVGRVFGACRDKRSRGGGGLHRRVEWVGQDGGGGTHVARGNAKKR